MTHFAYKRLHYSQVNSWKVCSRSRYIFRKASSRWAILEILPRKQVVFWQIFRCASSSQHPSDKWHCGHLSWKEMVLLKCKSWCATQRAEQQAHTQSTHLCLSCFKTLDLAVCHKGRQLFSRLTLIPEVQVKCLLLFTWSCMIISTCETRLKGGAPLSVYAYMVQNPDKPNPQIYILPCLTKWLNCLLPWGYVGIPSHLDYALYSELQSTRRPCRPLLVQAKYSSMAVSEPLYMLGRVLVSADSWIKLAYNLVLNYLLWTILCSLGLHGKMLAMLQSPYKDHKIIVHLSNRIWQDQKKNAGVRQGCLLSPTLFGLFWGLQYLGMSMQPGYPKLIGGRRVPLLMYAGDTNMMA